LLAVFSIAHAIPQVLTPPEPPTPPALPTTPAPPGGVVPDFTKASPSSSNLIQYSQDGFDVRSVVPDGWKDLGAVPETELITVTIGLKLPGLDMVKKKLGEISDPKSPEYRKFMSFDAIKALLGIRKEDVDMVLLWLKTLGLSATFDEAGYVRLTVEAGLLNKLLNTQFHNYQSVASDRVITRTLSYGIPTLLTDIISFVTPGTSFDGDFSHHIYLPRAMPKGLNKRQEALDCNKAITPTCLQQLYGIPSTRVAESNQLIAVLGINDEYANRADLEQFAKAYRS
ncbi:hypothetical protein BGW38_007802, partial [Lunasporangiospora selenospora]